MSQSDCVTYGPATVNKTSENYEASSYEDYGGEKIVEERGVGLALLAVLLSTIIAVAVIGNLLVVVAVVSNRRLRTVTNTFVGSLAFADFLVGVLVMPPSLAMLLANEWPLGQFACDLWLALDVLLCTASILNLCCISLDRYLAVTRPLAYWTRRSRKMAAVMLTVVWLAAFAITGPPVLGWQTSKRARGQPGQCQSTTETVYVVYSACGSFFIPLLIMLYVYGRILRVIYQRDKIIRRHKPSRRGGHRYSNARSEFDNQSTPNSSSSALPRPQLQVNKLLTSCTSTSTATTTESSKKHVYLQVAPGHTDRSYDPIPSPPPPRRRAAMDLSHSERLKMWLDFYNEQSTTAPCQNHGFRGRNGCPSCWSAKLTLYPYGSGINYYFVRQPSVARWNVFRRNMSIHQQEGMSFVKEKKAALALAFVVGGFVVCWMPFFVAYLLKPFCKSCQMSENVELFLTWLGWVNSAINPFIYAFSSLDFRMAFWRLTFGLCIREKPDTDIPFASNVRYYSNLMRERSRRSSSAFQPRSYQCSPRRLSSLKRDSFSAVASV